MCPKLMKTLEKAKCVNQYVILGEGNCYQFVAMIKRSDINIFDNLLNDAIRKINDQSGKKIIKRYIK